MNKTKWVLRAVYRPPSGNATRFRNYMSIILDMSLTRADNILLAGDLNLDALLPETSGKVLHDLCMTYDLHNLIKTATSFKGKPSLLDVILTNKPSLFHSSNSSECGLSDYHHIVYTLKRVLTYRNRGGSHIAPTKRSMRMPSCRTMAITPSRVWVII